MKDKEYDVSLVDVLKRKMFLSRYFFNLENISKECKEKYKDNPKKAIRCLLWWNFKQSLKIFTEAHANDYWEPYFNSIYRSSDDSKVMFPYEQIQKDSKVIIYGNDGNSRQIIEQNNITKYCKIIGIVVDQEEGMEKDIESVPIIDKIPDSNSFDYLIVSYSDQKKQQKILEELDNDSFPLSKTVFDLKEYKIKNITINDDRVRVYVIVTGGLGDYIVAKKALLALQEIDCNSVFFITSNDLKKKAFLDAIYFDVAGSYIKYENENEICFSEYDLVIRIDHIINVLYADMVKLRKKSKGFYKFADKWLNEYDNVKDFVQRMPFESVIHVNRAKVLKLDRYRIMASYTSLNICDHNVPIALKGEYKKDFDALNLPFQYITVNLGADSRPDGKMQVKTWPIENYNRLIEMIKEMYPYVRIVQIGNTDSQKMKKVDDYVFGCHLEIIKFVLKESQLHIDCEGGLVHLATQLGTCCAVMFGPTPAFYYGYEENINILPRVCGECMGTTEEWFTHCLCNDSYPAMCMKSITPECVFKNIQSKLESIK